MSAPFDYSGLLTVATELIDEFGKDATMRRQSAGDASPNRPWEGPDTTALDIQAIPVRAVFFDLSNDPFTTTGAGIGRGSTPVEEHRARVLIQADSALPEEIGTDWVLDDGVRQYAVTAARPQSPGPTRLYYELVVRV